MSIIYSRSSPYLVMITHREGADGAAAVTSGGGDGGGVVCHSGDVGSGDRVRWC